MNALHPALAWFLVSGIPTLAQVVPSPAPTPDGTVPLAAVYGARRTAAELEQLVAPIALYPDALIALILPAATVPADIVLAARQIRESGSDRSQIEHRAWDESVKSLTHYPEVLKWMDENLQWTKQLGEAFAEQPVEVMQAVQRLRGKARADGTLVDTPQQQVLTDLEVIRIVPAQASSIYVPYYEPSLIFLPEPIAYGRPLIHFGVGLPVGSWLAFECDWRRHTIWMGDRHRRWNGHDWRHPVVPIPIGAPAYARHPEVRPWRPPAPPGRYPRSVPGATAVEIVRAHPSLPPASRYDPPRLPTYRPPNSPRRELPGTVPAHATPNPAGPVLAPTIVTAPFARVPAAPPATEPASRPPAYTHRRGTPSGERDAAPSAPTTPVSRRHVAESRSYPTAPTTVVTAPPAYAPRHGGRSAAPSPATPAAAPATIPPRSAPPAHTRPAPPPASTPAPAPAATPPRTEVESERTVGRRSINER